MKTKATAANGPIFRLITLFVVLSMVPLALLTYSSLHLGDQAVVREVEARVRTTSAVAAILVQQQMESLAELVASYASRPVLEAALGDGSTATFDTAVIETQMSHLQGARGGISGVFLADTSCRLTHAIPATPSIVGVDFSFRDWCRGVRASGRPYVSEAYQTAITGNPFVVAAVTFVRAPGVGDDADPLGILGAVYSLDAIRGIAERLARAQAVRLTVTDQAGALLVGRDSTDSRQALVSQRERQIVRAALAGRSGFRRLSTKAGDSLAAFAPVAGIGWAVSAEVPADQALAGVARLRSTVLTIAGILGIILIAGLVLLVRTLYQRRRVERTLLESEARARGIIEAADDAFVSMDGGGVITAWNPKAEVLFGWTAAEAIGRRLSSTIVPPDLREAHESGLRRYLETGAGAILNRRTETRSLHRDGHQFPVELAVWPAGSDATLAFNAFVQDITDRKKYEEELAEARDKALEASRLKSEFLANMSHEIRTPMNGVLGMTALLLETDLSPEQRSYADTVRESGEALLEILNDILDLSKIEAGRLGIESVDFDLVSVVEEVTALMALRAQDKGLELVSFVPDDIPTPLRGDPGRLRQILANLVGNAVKFTDSGEVVLQVAQVAPGPETAVGHSPVVARFEITDTGIGIEPENQTRLFDKFSQADSSTTRRYGGTGLGLAICRQLVELMGGEIGLDSEPGRGSTFWFTVPLERGTATPDLRVRDSLSGLHVLAVDDNATNRTILSKFLGSWGMRPATADGAVTAIQMMLDAFAAGDPFEVAILDLNMPGVDGLGLARAISSDPDLAGPKLVLLTSSANRGEAESAREAGVDAYLTKPVRQSELYDCLARVMGAADDYEEVAADQRHQTGKGSLGRVLVAEDNPVNQKVAVGMLERLGFDTDVAVDGLEAVQAVARSSYQVVLMDCQMPRLDGYQATAEIRRSEDGSARTPIIALTASAMKADRERCLEAGMDDYLTKPVTIEGLRGVLSRWTAVQHPRAEPVPPPDDEGGATGTDPSAAPPDAAPLGGLDPEVVAGLRRLGDSLGENLLEQLIELFLTSVPGRVSAVRSAVASGDATAVNRAAHALKGSSATLGAVQLSRLCSELEASASRGELSEGGRFVEEIEAEVARLQSALGPLE